MKTRAFLTATALLASISLPTIPAQAQTPADVRGACESLNSDSSESHAQALFGTSADAADDFCDERGFDFDDDDSLDDDDLDDDQDDDDQDQDDDSDSDDD